MPLVVSGHDLLVTRDCAFPGCIDEARRGSEHCDRHAGGVDRVRVRSLVEAAKGDDVTANEVLKRRKRTDQGLCKIEGCPNKKNPRYSRGIYAGLCDEVHLPERRAQGISRSPRLAAAPASAPAPASRPEPGPFPPAPEGFEARAARLVDVSRRLDEARAELVAAEAKVEEAEESYRSAHAELALG